MNFTNKPQKSNLSTGGQTPSVGRIVHYNSLGKCLAGIIVCVNEDSLNLAVWDESAGYVPALNVKYNGSQDPIETNSTWHWPERV